MKLLKKVLFLSLFLVVASSTNLFANDGFMRTKKGKNVFVGQKIIHLIDNATVGAIQSVIGASHIVWYLIFDEGPDFAWHNNSESEVVQIEMQNRPPFFNGAYSLGLFQVGGYAKAHEGGHSVQSATLGPMYLPTIGMSYLMEGHGGSFMERWADMEASPEGYDILKNIEFGTGTIINNDQRYDVVTIHLSLDQVLHSESNSLDIKKSYQWLNTKVILPLVEKQDDLSKTAIFEIDLLKKETNVVVDNIALYLSGDQELKWQIKTSQQYLHYEQNPLLGLVHKKALSWEVNYGLRYNFGKNLELELNGGVNAGLEGIELSDDDSRNEHSGLSYGWQYDVSIKLYKKLKLKHSYQKVNLGDNSSYKKSFNGISYTKQKPFKFTGQNSRLELNIGSYKNTYRVNDFERSQSMLGLNLKLNF